MIDEVARRKLASLKQDYRDLEKITNQRLFFLEEAIERLKQVMMILDRSVPANPKKK